MSDQDSSMPGSAGLPTPSDEGALTALAALAALALARSGEGVYWTDREGRIVYANEAAARMLGYTTEELTALAMAELDADIEAAGWPAVWADIQARSVREVEARHRTKAGGFVSVAVATSILAHRDREVACSFVRDLTERRRLHEDLRAASKLAERATDAKTRFLAAASHDLRQPLHAMELLVSALSGKSLGEEGQSILSDMRESLAFAQRMLDTLLDVSELEAGAVEARIEPVPLAPLLRRAHRQYLAIAGDKGLELRFVPSSLTVRSDPGLLERIVDNLISNAVRYTDRGRVLIGCRRRGTQVRLEIWDSGPGIAEADQARIFDDFCQIDRAAKERGAGLGLGLGLVRRLAALLGHPVRVGSTVGRGSVFWIELDAEAPQADAVPAPLAGEVREESDEVATVMIVEDDAMVRNAMRLVLEGWGYGVIAVATAEAARAAEATPDVIIADYRLPGGETGDRAIEDVRRKAGRPLPGIIVTGEVMPAAWQTAETEPLQVMKKPVRPAKLRALIRHLLQA